MSCADSCAFARNGVCDDGSQLLRRGADSSAPPARIRCALGTDCFDCGPAPTASADGGADHPSSLFKQDSFVQAAWTATEPSFIMPYANPDVELGVSRSMRSLRAIEPANTMFWQALSEQCCARGGVALDVGANFGYYSLFSAAMGCRVLA